MAWIKRLFGAGGSGDPVALVRLGDEQYRRGEFGEAVASYTAALAAGSQDVQARIGRGQAYLDLGDAAAARADFEAALRHDAAAVRGHFFWRGQSLGEGGRLDDEIAAYTYVLDLDPTFALGYASRGNAYRQARDYARALADCDAALGLEQNDALFANRGRVYAEAGQFDRAVADFDAAVRLNPGEGSYYVDRAGAYRGMGDVRRAAADEVRGRELGAG
jgi:tetratricopeptide (TPR) repeat protein